ncbi:hypothetical protein SAY87_025891 [Trapa incisa]|uniref:Uncharacterized protein n=1 Tax=Trapa incisa TaxID=236973 RepID=A0AAN7GR80_9MYRT|nr:hypothetical protein SAY87_025891 [Trapa incisa]
MSPLSTHAAIYPVTRCTTVAVYRENGVRKKTCNLRNVFMGEDAEQKETYCTASSILHQHPHEPAHIPRAAPKKGYYGKMEAPYLIGKNNEKFKVQTVLCCLMHKAKKKHMPQ